MTDFNRKVGEASARVSQTVSEAADRLEKESAELIDYLNREVVPAVRQQSTKALRIAADKLQELANYMDEAQKSKVEDSEVRKP
jgi:hypothetical protein